jgi:hypothetical protein
MLATPSKPSREISRKPDPDKLSCVTSANMEPLKVRRRVKDKSSTRRLKGDSDDVISISGLSCRIRTATGQRSG